MDFDNFIIEIQETKADKWLTELELKTADFFDSKAGKSNTTWGGIVAAANDGFAAASDPAAASG
jgi:hypothetical protein